MERAALIGAVKVRLLETDEKFSLRGETLQRAIEKDREAGLIPFFVRSHNFTIIIPEKRKTLITHDGISCNSRGSIIENDVHGTYVTHVHVRCKSSIQYL